MNRNIVNCVQNGDITALKRIINSTHEGLDALNVCSAKSRDTVAILAARYGRLDILRYVYTHVAAGGGAGVSLLERANADGKRALHEAAQHGHLSCVKFLLSCGVDVDSLKRADWYV